MIKKTVLYAGWANQYETPIGTIQATRNSRLDANGNPRWTIAPFNWDGELPAVGGFHRRRGAYSTQSYNIDDTVNYLVQQLQEAKR